jgi:mRNA interferase RelE/StbE
MYRVSFTPKALEQMGVLNKSVAQQVLKKLRWMAENFAQATHLPLTGNLKGIFKLRVGDYRALYTFDEKDAVIVVHFVQHRNEVYKTK